MKKYYFVALSLLAMTIAASCSDNKQKQQEAKIEKVNSDAVEKARQDSLKQKAREDSLEQVRKDSIAVAEKKAKENINCIAIYKAGNSSGYDKKMRTMGFKVGPSFVESESYNYDTYYKNCTLDSKGNAIKVSNTGTPILVTIGGSSYNPEGYTRIEVFSKEQRDAIKKQLKSYIKEEYVGSRGKGVETVKTKLGWAIIVNYGWVETR